ncbi:MAG TPA: tRNA (adenosine(37)-N6)-threonylcarbamoyltransferase complex ATPase subunit type 1 TsaE [Blastocatellia bacterium]|jgi:tRNA threonylcarbamoyladenosine biosynthesis protein TsaE|nr:tRNA (adenosine(37)-N6)-threonylcarbamoyltransferase complex ATPase subunit type 1 TsaE [Blastocatellia bacterium]
MSIEGEFITRSAEETLELGRRVGEQLNGRSVFLLGGDLGAGKTVFAKGLAEGLGVDPGDVTSPSFTLINVYEGRFRLYHIDLYRLDGGACQHLGLEEIFDEDGAIIVIEWAERLGFVPEGAIQVDILYLSDSERRINIRRLSE